MMRFPRFLAALFVVTLVGSPADSSTTRRWILDTSAELLAGRGDHVEVTSEGRLQRVEGWTAGPSFDEPVVMAGALDSDGSLIVGTSHPARLYRVRGTSAELLAEVPAEQITAILITRDDGILVATIAPGVVFRWRGGSLEEAGRIADGGIWDLALFNGRVVVGGGPPASLYRLGERGLERWAELPDVHARCLEPTEDRLLVGTSGAGLILSVDADGTVGLLADSKFTEISDLTVGDGAVWATALVGEPAPGNAPKNGNGNGENGDEEEAEVAVSVDLDLPQVNGKSATSEVVKLTPEGGLLSIHRFTGEVASAVAWDGEGLLVGTGFEGEVWRFVDDGGARLATIDAVQVVRVIDGGAALLTLGPGGVVWRSRDDERAGRFRSPAKQFGQPARFGEYRVEPPSDDVRIRFRSGISSKPDDTWLPWTDWLPASNGRVPLPAARSLQWEVEIPGGAASSMVDRVEVATVEINLPPRLDALVVEEPGVVYLAAPPSSGPVIEAVHPDMNGVFTVIDEKAPANAKAAKGKKYYRAGYRTVSWKAADPNQDPLRFVLELEGREGFKFEVRERLEGTQLGVDTTSIPDGVYRFVLTASDEPRNPEGALETTRASRWFSIDNSPPDVGLERSGDSWVVTVSDGLSPIVRAEWSRDGESWTPLAPADGLLDGREETFRFPAESGRHMVVVRVVDRQHNRATAGAVEE
jgi:hypothetical protein